MTSATSKTKKLYSNLLQQNCYVRDTTYLSSCMLGSSDVPECLTYVSIDHVPAEEGIAIRRTLNSYPITAESVSSYLDSTDYRTDLDAVLAAPPRGINLGDLTELQRLSTMSDSDIMELIKSLSERLRSSNEKPTDFVDDSNNNNNEVNK